MSANTAGLDLIREVGEVARLARELPSDASVTDRLAYHRRKAELLTLIAGERDDQDARDVAGNAWRQVRELEEANGEHAG